jgi:hypothetical protein
MLRLAFIIAGDRLPVVALHEALGRIDPRTGLLHDHHYVREIEPGWWRIFVDQRTVPAPHSPVIRGCGCMLAPIYEMRQSSILAELNTVAAKVWRRPKKEP